MLLESDQSYRERLAEVIAQMERRIEGSVEEYIDDAGEAAPSSAEPSAEPVPAGSSATLTATFTATVPGSGKEMQAVVKTRAYGISDAQRRMVKNLNALPKLEKKLAFIDKVFNSHAVIISRDVKRFKVHERGHGVLKHLADHLLL